MNLPLIMAMPFAMGMQTARFVLVIGDRTGNRASSLRGARCLSPTEWDVANGLG